MALRGLVHPQEPGRICDIVEAGNEFEVHEDFSWVDLPDGTTTTDSYDQQTGQVIKFDITQLPGYAESAYKVARAIAYTEIGNQLDMLFKELQTTGTISNSGPWATHVASVKATIPKDNPQAVHEWNLAYAAQFQGNV